MCALQCCALPACTVFVAAAASVVAAAAPVVAAAAVVGAAVVDVGRGSSCCSLAVCVLLLGNAVVVCVWVWVCVHVGWCT